MPDSSKVLQLLVKFSALDRLTSPMRRITAGTREASHAVAETRREISGLEKVSGQIQGMKTLEQRVRGDTAALEQLREKMKTLRAEIRAAAEPTDKMTRGLSAMERRATALGKRIEGQGTALQGMAAKLERAGIEVTDLAAHEDRLALATHEANQRLLQQQSALERVQAVNARFGRAQALGGKMRGAGAGAVFSAGAAALPLIASVSAARELESGMTDVAQKANLTRAAAGRMEQQLLRLAPVVAQLPPDLQKGVDTLAGFGLDPRVAMQLIRPIGLAATAYKAEIADLSAALFSGVDNLKVPVGQAQRMLDVMATAGKDGAFELKDMAQYFPMLTASAQALGQRGVPAVADLAAALEIARKGTGDAASAADNLQNLLTKLNTKESIKNFKQFGVDLPAAMKKAAADGKTPIEAIAEITDKALKGNLGKLSFLFGDMQVQQALRPLIQNLGQYRRIRADALAAQGTVEHDFTERMRDSGAVQQRFGAQMMVLRDKLGTQLLPAVDSVERTIGRAADAFVRFSDAHPRLSQGLVVVAAAGIALVGILGALAFVGGVLVSGWGYLALGASTLTPLLGLLGRGVMLLGGAFLRAGLMMLANPMVLVIMALVVAVAVAGYLIWKHWDKIKAAFAAGWQYLQGLWANFKSFGAHLIEGLIEGVGSRLAALRDRILGIGKSAVTWFRGVLGIHSPSRVFAELGGFMTAGLERGLDRGARGPIARVRALAGQLAAAAVLSTPAIANAQAIRSAVAGTPAPSSARASRPAAPAIGALHIHQQPGEDAEALARRVIALIEQSQSVRARSAYDDDEA